MTAVLEETIISNNLHINTSTSSTITTTVTPSQHGDDSGASSVQVAVRIRPMLPHEAGNMSCVEVLKESTTSRLSTVIRLGGDDGPNFTFDQVFPLTTTQSEVYNDRVAPLVSSCLEGYNATILAYGQTGSGKTHTIMGPSASISAAVQDERQGGVIPRAIRSIFDQLNECTGNFSSSDDDDDDPMASSSSSSSSSYEYCVRVQFLEVYGQEIRDLLAVTQQTSSTKLSIRDVGLAEPEVVGASEQKVESAEEALLCLTKGMYRRVTGATSMNETSSRSHAIFSLIVEQQKMLDRIDGTPKKGRDDGDTMQRHLQARRSKFNFVDLAGSERQKRTNATGQRLKEGININQGLLVLGNVISALGDPKKQGKTFVPYRDSNLTRLLKGSLGGNHKTLMIACVSPAANNMEESLNCLRYANRAKNIQNHAVVNVDATSRLVMELRGKMQLLASDLLKAREGNIQDLSIPLDVVESLAAGGDGEAFKSQPVFGATPITIRTSSTMFKENISPLLENIRTDADELQRLKAENELYKIKLESFSSGDGIAMSSDALEKAFLARAAEYERDIAVLRAQAGVPDCPSNDSVVDDTDNTGGIRRPRSPRRKTTTRDDSPELIRLRSQMFGSMAQEKNLEAEVEAEEEAISNLTSKYLRQDGMDDEDGIRPTDADEFGFENEESAARLEAEVYELSHSIDAKEELIKKLQASHKKFQEMREFYEGKLKEMESQLSEKAQEAKKLNEELSMLDKNSTHSQALSDRLMLNQQQVADLKRKQAELSRLSSHASRNECQIARLSKEVIDMKHKKVELQKQITTERKNHAQEVQKLKKESMQQQRELNKMKQQKEQKNIEAEKAQQVAKSRLDQVIQLKSRYKESEKRLRILTVKRGVMSRAGLDPVMVGRRQTRGKSAESSSDAQSEERINIDALRDFFDQKVADVSRREALAEKLAQEWEDHLELSSQRDEIMQNASEEEDVQESIDALESRIKFKEERIRQLASRLGKPRNDTEADSRDDEQFLFTKDFENHVVHTPPLVSAKIAAKILFGMVVRERRRIAALARTASSLDEKVQAAERTVAEKDFAFRAYVDEHRLEAADMAEQQQQHILSLINMVKEQPDDSGLTSPVRSAKARHAEKANSKLLLLANERIAVLESQLSEMSLGRDEIQKHRDREADFVLQLQEKTRECDDLEQELSDLRSAMRHIRQQVTIHEDLSVDDVDDDQRQLSKSVLDIVVKSLHPKGASDDDASRRRRRSVPFIDTHGLAVRHQMDLDHNSDSDEVPDWADDIMKDLETIAKGEMPSSLLQAVNVVHVQAQLENPSVFDRLTDPQSFTGIQKQKKTMLKTTKKPKQDAEMPASNGQKHRKIMSKQIAHSLDKLVLPSNQASTDSTSRKPKESSSGRSVFDRLLSPSNLTGTQKQRFQDTKGKRDNERPSDEHKVDEKARVFSGHDSDVSREADKLLSDILDDDMDEKSGSNGKGVVIQNTAKSKSTRKREEYQGLDVFERLNKTTTEAYAVKQNLNIAEKLLDDLLEDANQKQEVELPKAEFHNERMDAYTRQDVFERLQKTTTRAYAVKQIGSLSFDKGENDYVAHDLAASIVRSLDAVLSPGSRSKDSAFLVDADGTLIDKPSDESSGGENSLSDHTSPVASRLRPRQRDLARGDVFERLQKTTTEAFDMKKPPHADR